MQASEGDRRSRAGHIDGVLSLTDSIAISKVLQACYRIINPGVIDSSRRP